MEIDDVYSGLDELPRKRRARPDLGLRAELRKRLKHLGQWASIETGATEQGVPDLYLMPRDGYDGRGIWVECKKAEANAVKFRPGQVGWLFTHYRYGGRAYVFVRLKNKIVDELHIVNARWVRELDNYGLRGVPPDLCLTGGPGAWGWLAVERLLLQGAAG